MSIPNSLTTPFPIFPPGNHNLILKHTTIFKMDNQQGPITEQKELYSMYVATLMGGEFGERVDTCICMADSLCCFPETITTLFVKRLYPKTK